VSSAPASSRLLLNNTLLPGARQKSTSARTRRALNIAPHPSVLTTPNHPNRIAASAAAAAVASARPTTNEIIFNPPSSAASVFHTPFKFLPKNDPRRRANLASSLFSPTASNQSPSASTATVEDFPSIGKPPVLKPRHHLTKADIEEMRRLRAEDPVANSVVALSRRFQCTTLFVLMCCQASREHREMVKEQTEKAKERWGPRRRAARDERARRNVMVYNGEL
jgi:hypothetical protein